MTRGRLRLLLPARRGDPRASLVAFLVQSLLIWVIAPALLVPIAADFLRDDRGIPVTPERISFLATAPRGRTSETEAPRAGGDGRARADRPAEGPAEPAPVLVAPTEIPTAVFPARPAPRRDPAGSGPVIGGGGPLEGIQPAFTDPRLWLPPGEVVIAPNAPRTRAESLQVMLAERTAAYLDSMAALPVERRPGDWTFEKGGKTWGIDERFIRLGDFKIPTILLAAMPMNAQANPMARERALRLDAMRQEIQFQAARQARDDEFRAAVRALRERKERERREAEAQKKAGPVVDPARP